MITGMRFCSGTTHGFELVFEFCHETQTLAKYAELVATATDDILMRMKEKVEKVEILLLHKLDQLKRDMEKRFLGIDEVSTTGRFFETFLDFSFCVNQTRLDLDFNMFI